MQLAKASWAVVANNKALALLPLVSGLATLAVIGTFAVPVFLLSDGGNGISPVAYPIMFLGYLVLGYVALFFQTALLHGADEYLRGGHPTFGSALDGAAANAGRILPWAILSSTVSVVLQAVEQKAGIVGRIVASLVGMAWAVVTFLVLPIVVFENIGLKDAVKRSATLFRQTWGENLVVNGGIGLVTMAAFFGVLVVGGILGVAAAAVSPVLLGLVIALAVVAFIGVMCVSSAMSGVARLVVYRYAVDRSVPAAFAGADLGGLYQTKTRRQRPWSR